MAKAKKREAANEQVIITSPTPGLNETLSVMGGNIMGGAMGFSRPDEIGLGKLLYVQARVYDQGASIPANPTSTTDPPQNPTDPNDKVNWSTSSLTCATGGNKTLAVWGTFQGNVVDLDTVDFSAFVMDDPIPLVAARARALSWPARVPKFYHATVARADAPRRQPLGRYVDAGIVQLDAIVLKYDRRLSEDDDGEKVWDSPATAARPAHWQLRVRKQGSQFDARLILVDFPDSGLPDSLFWAVHVWSFNGANRLRRQHTISEPLYFTVRKRPGGPTVPT